MKQSESIPWYNALLLQKTSALVTLIVDLHNFHLVSVRQREQGSII